MTSGIVTSLPRKTFSLQHIPSNNHYIQMYTVVYICSVYCMVCIFAACTAWCVYLQCTLLYVSKYSVNHTIYLYLVSIKINCTSNVDVTHCVLCLICVFCFVTMYVVFCIYFCFSIFCFVILLFLFFK